MPGHNHFQNRTRNRWTILVGVVVVTLLLSGCGTQTPKVYRVGIVCGVDSMIPIADGFKAKMTELGYAEGQNIVYDVQKLNADPAGEQRTAKKFVADKVDLIFAFPDGPALAAKAATQGTNIPVVFANTIIEASNVVNSVREPGGNMTGVRYPGPDQLVKSQEIFVQLLPKAKRMWIAYDPNYSVIPPMLEIWRPVILASGVTLVEVHITSVADIQADLEAREKSGDIGIDAIALHSDLITRSPEGFEVITQFANKHKLPIVGGSRSLVQKGSLYGFTTDHLEQGRLAANLSDKILKGARAGTLPVLTPESRLVLNYKRAQELGLTVPEGLLKQAAEVIR
jgi:putative tryptophan/tyrosine transport system substrate-binding protein